MGLDSIKLEFQMNKIDGQMQIESKHGTQNEMSSKHTNGYMRIVWWPQREYRKSQTAVIAICYAVPDIPADVLLPCALSLCVCLILNRKFRPKMLNNVLAKVLNQIET